MVRRVSGLDDLARIFFPDNLRHQRAFVALWLEIKYSEETFLPSSKDVAACYEITQRILEIVRAKMKRIGLIKRVSHYNPAFGHRSGWTFSSRFRQALSSLSDTLNSAIQPQERKVDEQKDRNALLYL